jgi:DNA-binding XRE family transcriptional regulator
VNKFQERLQDLILENNINRLQLAKILSISSTTINGYFNNNYYPQIDIAVKMADYFNCSLDYLFGLSEVISNENKNANAFIVNFGNLLAKNKMPIARALREMKMSEYNYYRWKSGKIPKTVNLIDIAKYFDCSLDYLVGRTDKK